MFAFRRTSVVLCYLLPELLFFIIGALSEGLFVLRLLLLGDLVALMASFTDLAMLLFENPVSLLFSKALLILPKAICFPFLNHGYKASSFRTLHDRDLLSPLGSALRRDGLAPLASILVRQKLHDRGVLAPAGPVFRQAGSVPLAGALV